MDIDLTGVRSIYFIGMGGIGMSAAAGLAKEQGYEVAGSDAATVYPPASDILNAHEIEIGIGYSKERIAGSNADLFVVSSGEDQNNPEVAWLLEEDKRYISFCELLYALSLDKLRIVVAGTHGKSTTSGLLGHLLRSIDDSSFMVGAVLKEYDTNFHSGEGHYIVFEGDEYKSTFDDLTPKMHYYKGDILVLTNLEFDHPDLFQDLEEIKGEFRQLITNLPDDGIVLYNADNQSLADIVYGEGRRSFTFGIEYVADVQAVDIIYSDEGTTFTVMNRLDPANTRVEHYRTQLVGVINVYNALAAIATLRALGFQPELIQQYLGAYSGVKRRFDVLVEKPIAIVDDYAHHPTAVQETLDAARRTYFAGGKREGKLWAVFEPHTFSRTRATLTELSLSFTAADEVLLAPIYGAREHANTAGITSEEVLKAVQAHQPHTRLILDKGEALKILQHEAKAGDVVVVMAVGSFNRLAHDLAADMV